MAHPKEPKTVGLPHGRRQHDKRSPNKHAKSLFYEVCSRRAREGHEESLGEHRFREDDPSERDEDKTTGDYHDCCLIRCYSSRHPLRAVVMRQRPSTSRRPSLIAHISPSGTKGIQKT